MSDWPTWAVLLVVCPLMVLLAYLDVRWNRWIVTDRRRCKCGKKRRWYFEDPHEKTRFMIVPAVVWSACAVASATDVLTKNGWFDWVWTVICALLAFYNFRRIYYHEKGKLRSVVRQLGRVVVTEHGTLKVAHAKD